MNGLDAQRFVDDEIAKRLKQGFVEVVPEAVAARAMPSVAPDAAWIARIADAEDDDAPRLVYADWLGSKGDPLGEMIAVQCQLARLAPWDPQRARLAEREAALLILHRHRWIPNGVDADMERGFIARVRLVEPVDPAQIEAIVAAAPLVRTVEIVPRPGWGLTVEPWRNITAALWARLTGLYMRTCNLGPARLRELVDKLSATRIDRLGLRSFHLTAPDLKIVAKRAWRELDVHANTLGARGVSHLAANAGALEVLDIGSCGVGDDGAVLLAAMPKLRRLSLRRSRVTHRSLARVAGIASLRALDLSANELDVAAIDALADAPLDELDLHDTTIGDAGVEALVGSPLGARLVSLDVAGTGITERGTRALATLTGLRRLRVKKRGV